MVRLHVANSSANLRVRDAPYARRLEILRRIQEPRSSQYYISDGANREIRVALSARALRHEHSIRNERERTVVSLYNHIYIYIGNMYAYYVASLHAYTYAVHFCSVYTGVCMLLVQILVVTICAVIMKWWETCQATGIGYSLLCMTECGQFTSPLVKK